MDFLGSKLKCSSDGSSYFYIVLVLLILNSVSALLFISTVRRPVYDDSRNLLDVQRYATQGITPETIRNHINATGPTSFIWMASAVRLIGGDALRDARLGALLSWVLLGVGVLIAVRNTRCPAIWHAAMMVTFVFPHTLTAMSTVLTEGPAMLFAVMGSLGFMAYIDHQADTPRPQWLGILAGLLMGLAVTARQYYLAVPAAALLLILWRWWEKERHPRALSTWEALQPLVAAAIPVLLLVILWGSLSSPSMASGASYARWTSKVGLNLFRPVIAALYIAIYFLPLTFPAVLSLRPTRYGTVLLAIAGGILAGLGNLSLQMPGPLHSMLQMLSRIPGAVAICFGFIAAAAILNTAIICQLLWERRAEMLRCTPMIFAIVLILLFCAEQAGVGGNLPFYERYVLQMVPFLGLIAFGLFPRFSLSRIVGLVFLLVVSYGMQWRNALH